MTIQDNLQSVFDEFDDSTLHIVDGLPGSGKTSLAMKIFEFYQKEDDQIYYLNVDDKDYNVISTKPNYGFGNKYPSIVVDGLFSDTLTFFKKFSDSHLIKRCWWYSFRNVVIHSFIPNIENCIINDKDRREQDSIRSIHMNKEFITRDLFLKYLKESDVKHLFSNNTNNITIQEYSYEVPVYDKSKLDDSILYSDWKSLSVEDDMEFTELDAYLEKEYPTITFLQYKKLTPFINKNTTTEYDYYDQDGTNFIQYSIKYSDIYSILGDK